MLAWRDVLHEGPVPPGNEATVREARARFFVETGWDDRAEHAIHELERRDSALLEALAEGREVVLWFEHDLYDQLQLVQALALVAGSACRPSVRLICIDRFEGHPGFAGLGELDADELASLWPLRRAWTRRCSRPPSRPGTRSADPTPRPTTRRAASAGRLRSEPRSTVRHIKPRKRRGGFLVFCRSSLAVPAQGADRHRPRQRRTHLSTRKDQR